MKTHRWSGATAAFLEGCGGVHPSTPSAFPDGHIETGRAFGSGQNSGAGPNAVNGSALSFRTARKLQMFAEIPNSEYVRADVNHSENAALQIRAGVRKSSFRNRNAIHSGPLPKIETKLASACNVRDAQTPPADHRFNLCFVRDFRLRKSAAGDRRGFGRIPHPQIRTGKK